MYDHCGAIICGSNVDSFDSPERGRCSSDNGKPSKTKEDHDGRLHTVDCANSNIKQKGGGSMRNNEDCAHREFNFAAVNYLIIYEATLNYKF